MKRNSYLLIITAVLSLAFVRPVGDEIIIGFSPENSARQEALEDRFDAMLTTENLRTWMKHLTARPQHVGSPQGAANAEYVRDLFNEWGFKTEIETYYILFPTPKELSVELVAPEFYRLKLEEPMIEEDASSQVRENLLPPYNAYSADGDVEAEVVYVNQGIPKDYEELERMGISVKGKIVLARYGGSWRGIKVKVAFEHGAVATILYSDPLDDGYVRGDVYPEGPFRMARGVQRGSVSDMPLYPGDPLTPFIAATKNAERYSPEEAPSVMKIPVLPISYEDATPILAALGGPVVPASWKGGVPVTYHVGPGPARVHMRLKFNWDIVPAHNVIARIEGSEYPDEWVMRGNHRDGWAFGASDPTSGQVAMLEEARAIGELLKTGWRPKRTIIFASWDAEEPGLLGSTEWVEDHADELREKLVTYINTDSNGRGFLNMGGSHTLEPFINQIARDVTDPQTGVSVAERSLARKQVDGSLDADHTGDLPISPLGSGSDYTPFLQHLGISSLNLGFGGENAGGSYHSAFDTFEHYIRFGDRDFMYGIALAQVTGRATLRLANADVLPFRFTSFSTHVAAYLTELKELETDLREETEQKNALVESGAYQLAADPTLVYVAPEMEADIPHLNFAPLLNAMHELEEAAENVDKMLEAATGNASTNATSAAASLNRLLYQIERSMTSDEGLPRRPWFRHLVYAPGFYTGYGVKTLPGVREAIEKRAWDEAEVEIARAAEMLGRVTTEIRRIVYELSE